MRIWSDECDLKACGSEKGPVMDCFVRGDEVIKLNIVWDVIVDVAWWICLVLALQRTVILTVKTLRLCKLYKTYCQLSNYLLKKASGSSRNKYCNFA